MGKLNVKQTRWSYREWNIVAWKARQLIGLGHERQDALAQGQQLLPPERRANARHLHELARPKHPGLAAAFARLDAMSLDAVREMLPAQELQDVGLTPPIYLPRDQAKWATACPYKGRKTLVKWTPLEWALITRRADTWHAAGSNAGMARLLQEAQEIELPPERRRPRAALMVSLKAVVEPTMARARTEWAELVAGIPYDPHARNYSRPAAQQASPPPEETMTQALAKAQAEVEATTAPPASVAPLPEAPRPLPEPVAKAPAASLAPSAAHQAALLFGERLAAAITPLVQDMLEGMLKHHEQVILARVHEQQKAHAETLAADMSRLLLVGLDEMLGGSKPPAPKVVVEGPTERQALQKIKVDVVGFSQGHQKLLLQQRLNGTAERVDMRFIGPDDGTTYTPSPERHIVLLTGRVPHSLSRKVKTCGSPVTCVERTVSDVATVIRQLVEQAQAPLAAPTH